MIEFFSSLSPEILYIAALVAVVGILTLVGKKLTPTK